MKAAVLHGARDLRIEPYRQPELHPGMVLLRPRRVGICGTDLHYYEHGHNATFMPDRPFILGHELTAEVAAVGRRRRHGKSRSAGNGKPRPLPAAFVPTARAARSISAERPSCWAAPAPLHPPMELLRNSSLSARINVICCLRTWTMASAP